MANQTVTAADIEGLRRSAAVAGDHLQVLICGMALHGGEVSDDDLRLVPLSQHHLVPAGESEAIAACTEALESDRAMDDSVEVQPHQGEVCAVHASCSGDESDCRTARGTVPVLTEDEPYEASLPRALDWASDASAGEYLVEYSETGMTDVEDPGSRCGYDDSDLDAIRRALAERGLTLTSDDRGLMAQAVRR